MSVQIVQPQYLGRLGRQGTWHCRWNTRGQVSQQSSSPPLRHTAHQSSFELVSSIPLSPLVASSCCCCWKLFVNSQTKWTIPPRVQLIIWKLNLLIHFNNAGIMHSFFKRSDKNSISACLLPRDFIAVITFNTTYQTFSVFPHPSCYININRRTPLPPPPPPRLMSLFLHLHNYGCG